MSTPDADHVSRDSLTARFQDQYLGKRAREIATGRAATILKEQMRKAEEAMNSLRQMAVHLNTERQGAVGAADAIRAMAKSLGVDLSDEMMGPKLVEAANADTAAIFQALGLRAAGKSATETLRPDQPSPAPADPGANLPPSRGVVTTKPKFNPAPKSPVKDEEVEATEEVEPVSAPAAAAVRKGGRISTVTPRAAEAMARFKKGAKDERGVTHRTDALTDKDGRQIPVAEMLVVDDDAPAPEGGADGDGKVGTTHLDDDPPPEA